jgi:hypothetical protein
LQAKAQLVIVYLKELKKEKLLNSFCKYVNTDNNKGPLDFTLENIFSLNEYQSCREAVIINIGDKLNTLLVRNDIPNKKTYDAIMFFSSSSNLSSDEVINLMYFSLNLFDEKIIPKKSQLFFYESNNVKFEIVGNDILSITKKSHSWTHEWNSDFDISFYIKKFLFEKYTEKDFFTFLCVYKDFLSSFIYLNHPEREKRFRQDHPAIIESNLEVEIKVNLSKIESRYNFYYNKLQEVNTSIDTLFISKNVNEWIETLNIPMATKNSFLRKFSCHWNIKCFYPFIDIF